MPDDYEKVLKVYMGDDREEAERRILRYLKELSDLESRYPQAIEYNKVRATLFLKLYGIYRHGHNDAKAAYSLQRAVALYQSSFAGIDPHQLDLRLIREVDEFEQAEPPGWKKK
jgi:hypothetical protein